MSQPGLESGPTDLGGEREVRRTVVRVIRDHLTNPESPTSWSRYSFDFSHAVFDGNGFDRCRYLGFVSFRHCKFVDSFSFDGAVFENGAWFDDTSFSGRVSFDGAQFRGGLSFNRAIFSGGCQSLSMGARVDGGLECQAARFIDGDVLFALSVTSGNFDFRGCNFEGGKVSLSIDFDGKWATFDRAQFAGAEVQIAGKWRLGQPMSFTAARFTAGSVAIQGKFSGGDVRFKSWFDGANVQFAWSDFSDGATFVEAVMSDGVIDFSHATAGGTGFLFGGTRITGAMVRWGDVSPEPGDIVS
jgi:uncharacterized protein YjbI with pentapeptide repeats